MADNRTYQSEIELNDASVRCDVQLDRWRIQFNLKTKAQAEARAT
jgi:hypothetical protein